MNLTRPMLRYLQFLSPRTPRPKGCDSTFKTRKALYAMGLVEMARPDDWLARANPPGNATLKITDAGEKALDAVVTPTPKYRSPR